ncbi:hypothetical protein V1477_003311 [Vespula maculifrons]|uniref:Uncharacterized protein n=1 Tax=Vespula maculifrons TaxID=7453 RepID=A0ABD2CWW7_VESMC
MDIYNCKRFYMYDSNCDLTNECNSLMCVLYMRNRTLVLDTKTFIKIQINLINDSDNLIQ